MVPPVTDWATAAGYDAYLPAQTILAQISAAVVVTDRQGNLLYANPFATALFGFPKKGKLLGRPVLSLAFSGGDAGKAAELAKQVLRGRPVEEVISPDAVAGADAVPAFRDAYRGRT